MPTLPLVGKLGSGKHVIVSRADYQRCAQYRWRLGGNGYVYASHHSMKGTTIAHFILGVKTSPRRLMDHINRNPLDNRRSNLRILDPSKSLMNRITKPGETGERFIRLRKKGSGGFFVRVQGFPERHFKNLQEAVMYREECIKCRH